MTRFTFVVQIHPGGISTLENLGTQQQVRLASLDEIGPQIESWLAAQPTAREFAPVPDPAHSEPGRRG